MQVDLDIENSINFFMWGKLALKSPYLKKLENEYNETFALWKRYLNEKYPDSPTLKEKVYRLKYNINIRPVCQTCSKPSRFLGGKQVFTKHCNCTCAQLNPESRKNYEESCIKKYGVKNGAQTQQAKDKYIKHIREKYNDPTIINAFQAKEVKLKSKQTCLKKYGVNNFGALQSHKDKLKSQETINKRNSTKRKNNTFNTSKPENETYLYLKSKFSIVERQFKSKEYPFACDFYIPSLDLFIECNYHWTHGGKPYEGTEDDIKLVKEWESKNKKYYNNAIYAWTNLDVKKRNTAKENNLNWIEFWNEEELKNYFK